MTEHLIARQCAARCSLCGFQMFVLFEVVINEPTFPLSHTPTNNVRYIAFSMSFNENKLRTHTYIKF